ERMRYPGAWALVPTLGALLLIAAGPQGVVNRLVLSLPAVVFVGLISYPLYLWHWPLLSFRSILGRQDDWTITLCLVAISFALAIGTYLFIERHVRGSQRVAVPVTLMSVTLSIFLVGLLGQASLLGPRLDGARYHDIDAAAMDWRYPKGLK